jgi:hypothetical protein
MNPIARSHELGGAPVERPPADPSRKHRDRSRGQVLVIFAGAAIILLTLMSLVIDVSWYWANTLRVQRAADAAAMAGAVWLPGNVTKAIDSAKTEATKNGYTNPGGGCAAGTVCVTPSQDALDPEQLNVTVTAPVPTFFMRVLGIQSIPAARTAKAVFVQKLPMGSPLNYYGVYQDCKVSGTSVSCTNLPNPTGGTLTSQGFFGAIEGQGANRATGDAFATAYNPDPTLNDTGHSGGLIVQQYDPNGYEYQVKVTANNSTLYVYDPTFCATTSGPGGGHLGAGDHWLSTTSHTAAVPVSTYFRLFDTKGTLFTTTDDGPPVADSGTFFANEKQVDKSAAYSQASAAGGQNNDFSDGTEPTLASTTDCSAGAVPAPVATESRYWHNRWWPMASNLPAGIYRLQVTTTDPNNPAANQSQAFENMWSLAITGGGSPTIAGSGRMVTYANIQSGSQLFYLSQIDRTAAGKTLEIDLFDPGDVGDKAWLQILSPDGNVYTPATFNWTADSYNTSPRTTGATNVTCIQTYGNSSAIAAPAGCDNYTSGGQFFQNSWIKITMVLPAGYGSTGLTPPGEPAPGWWKVKYTVNKGNDTTTWMVSLRGNPVHLVVP